ncbi:RusA family crossover junction endodeoxyribonuclease [Aurantiacibacter spongiae]|uniref:Uncharacterized protein n=1 Tax=Aurantiacibacter spongiae TaxID=2488860 RepID=A0A3N5CSZ1_9SPHN|nr:hypothetical protein [Aurantiacibacter spongiae]RPF70460.1 hypothetical protein EG799_01555 [Aurantiacibacter spongiae]
MRIDLPWPDRRLNPNARAHYMQLASVKKKAREDAALQTIANVPVDARRSLAQREGAIPVTITFCPPDNRRRDIDNMFASLKAALDGIADGLRVDDTRFEPTLRRGEPVKPGRVEVVL